MTRFQRRLHLILWLLVGPACLALLWLAMHAQPTGDSTFTITDRSVPAEASE